MNKQFQDIEASIRAAKESRDAAQDFVSDLQALYRLISGNDNWNKDVAVLDVLNHTLLGKQYQKFLKRDADGLYYVSCECLPFKHLS